MDTKPQINIASTSSGANYEESQGSPTIPDVKTKICSSLKRMRKANFSLQIFSRLKLWGLEKSTYLVNESVELKKYLLPFARGRLSIHFFITWGFKFGI